MLSCLPPELAHGARRALLSCAVLAPLIACDSGLTDSDAAPSETRHEAGAAPSRDGEALSGPAQTAQPEDAGNGGGAGARGDAALASAMDAAATDAGPIARDAAQDAAAPVANERSRDFVVGTRRIEIATDGERVLPVQLWYPASDQAAAEAETGHGIEEFEAPGPRRELLTGLIPNARKDCPTLTMHAALEAAPYPRSTPFPLLVYSHHFNGSRFSMFSIAEGLAREGMVVAAPDHVGGSLFERQGGVNDSLSQFNDAFLQTRAADLRRVLDVLLAPSSELVPVGLRGRLDPARVGALGHSLGGFTVGVLSVNDTRVRASAYLAMMPSATLAMLLLELPQVERLRTPALYLTAHEDAVVQTLGGEQEVMANFDGQAPAASWVDVRDVGHFSFADDCGLVPDFDEGCGMGMRVGNGESFAYLEAKRAREIAVHYTTAFFAAELLGAPAARLAEALPPELVSVKQHAARTQADAGSP